MSNTAHLWAIGYDDMERAEQVRQTTLKLGETGCLSVLDTAVVIRYPDGSVTLDGKPYVGTTKTGSHTGTSIFGGVALAADPLCAQAVRALLDCVGAGPCEDEIDKGFVLDVQSMIKPGTSVLFVLDHVCDKDAMLQGIRGLGGMVLKTNVDSMLARQTQYSLADGAHTAKPCGDG
jgi:uncharacterized membrane protein